MEESGLFTECLEALAPEVKILSKMDSDRMWRIFKKVIPLVFWGRVDWDKIPQRCHLDAADEIIPVLTAFLQKRPDPTMYIFWNDASEPVLKAQLPTAIGAIDDVTCVGPDTWFLNLEDGYIVEFFHEGEIVVGLIPCISEIGAAP